MDHILFNDSIQVLLPNGTDADITICGPNATQNFNSCQTSPRLENSLKDGEKIWTNFLQPLPIVLILVLAYLTVFILALVNNSMVIAAICINAKLKTVTNMFIANLAVADILVSILVLPITLLSVILEQWLYGPVLCKVVPYLQGVSVGASVNTLVAIALERYFAILGPPSRRITPSMAWIIIAVIWIFPMCLFVPWAVYFQQENIQINGHNYSLCYPKYPNPVASKIYNLCAVFLFCYIVPLSFIAFCYSFIACRVWRREVTGIQGSRAHRSITKAKTRTLRMLSVVFIVFALSWLPRYCLDLRVQFGPVMHHTEKEIIRRYLVPFSQWLGASNSCVNPFIYCYFCEQFRKSIFAVFKTSSCNTTERIAV